jgi:hypothetical protein
LAAINDYVRRESWRVSVSSTQAVALAPRSPLRFLHLEGAFDRDLAVAVPSVAKWRLASFAKAVESCGCRRWWSVVPAIRCTTEFIDARTTGRVLPADGHVALALRVAAIMIATTVVVLSVRLLHACGVPR